MAEAGFKKHQMEYIAVGVLVLAAFFIGIQRFKKKDTDDEVFSRKEFNKKWKEVSVIESKVPKEAEVINYNLETDRIPFEGPFDEEKIEAPGEDISLPAISFQGMVWNSIRPQVIIDNKVYDIGDTINIGSEEDRVEVTDITKEGIYLKYKRKEFIVRPK